MQVVPRERSGCQPCFYCLRLFQEALQLRRDSRRVLHLIKVALQVSGLFGKLLLKCKKPRCTKIHKSDEKLIAGT